MDPNKENNMPKKLVINCKTHKAEYVDLTQEEVDQRNLDVIAGVAAKAEDDRKAKIQKREMVVEFKMKKTEADILGPAYAELATELQKRIDGLEAELEQP